MVSVYVAMLLACPGTLMELGISPIVTSSLIMQVRSRLFYADFYLVPTVAFGRC